eukprot:SAG31_NODE_1360_length_8638_cov_55.988055_11_plen_227_part_01
MKHYVHTVATPIYRACQQEFLMVSLSSPRHVQNIYSPCDFVFVRTRPLILALSQCSHPRRSIFSKCGRNLHPNRLRLHRTNQLQCTTQPHQNTNSNTKKTPQQGKNANILRAPVSTKPQNKGAARRRRGAGSKLVSPVRVPDDAPAAPHPASHSTGTAPIDQSPQTHRHSTPQSVKASAPTPSARTQTHTEQPNKQARGGEEAAAVAMERRQQAGVPGSSPGRRTAC